jgi:hypothetical protein
MLFCSTQDLFNNVMQNNIRKTENNQLPAQVEAVQITINEDDVSYAIQKLSLYDDPCSRGIVTVFNSYLKHKDFKRMQEELEAAPESELPPHLLWDINANIGFSSVIFPFIEKGGASC